MLHTRTYHRPQPYTTPYSTLERQWFHCPHAVCGTMHGGASSPPPPCLAVRRCSKALVRVHRQQTAQLAALSILWDRVDDERVTAAAEARRAVDVAAAQTKGPQAPAPTHY